MGKAVLEKIKGKEMLYFCIVTAILLAIMALCTGTPIEILMGEITIILSRDALITDYFELAGRLTSFIALIMDMFTVRNFNFKLF